MSNLREMGVIFNMTGCLRFRTTVNFLPAEKKKQLAY